jgi:predicted SprT family Zn-dependent metalloprotease
LVAPLLFGKLGCAHQIGWRQVMQLFGFPPERTHHLPVGELRYQHRVVAKGICGCKDLIHEIKPIRFRKIRYGRRRYRCLKCRQELRLAGI